MSLTRHTMILQSINMFQDLSKIFSDKENDWILEYFTEGCISQTEKKQEKADLSLCLQKVLYLLGLYI